MLKLPKTMMAVGMAFVMFAMTGCGGSGASSSAATSGGAPESTPESAPAEAQDTAQNATGGDAIEVEIWEYFPDNEHEYFTNMMEAWGEKNGYKFNIVQYPYADLNKQYTLGLASGELPDIAMINNCDNESFVDMGLLQDITAQIEEAGLKDKFYESSMNTTTIDGKIYGLPYNSNDLALFYDIDQFEAAGIDAENLKTWDDLEEAAGKLTSGNTYGFSMSLIGTDEATFQFFPFLYSGGADMYSMGSDEAIEAMQFLKDLYDDGFMSSEVINQGQMDINEQFVQGNVAMMVNGPWEIPIIKEEAPDKNWSVMPIPIKEQQASALGGEGFSIVSGADVDKIWPVMAYMFEKETLADWCYAMGKIPSRSDAVDCYPGWSEDPLMQVFFGQFEYAATLGPDAKWPEISKHIYSACQAAMTGQKSVEDACKEAQTKIDELVASK